MIAINISAYLLATLMFWFSIALTEGWKWRMDYGRPDNNSLINYKNYHVWRAVTTASFVIAILALGTTSLGFLPLLSLLVFSNLAANQVYEFTMSYAQEDKWFVVREKFHIMGRYYNRPSIRIQKTWLVLTTAATVASVIWAL